MATEKQILANRANATKSRGPKTPAGKARASQNAHKHTLDACNVIAIGEDNNAFNAFLGSYSTRFQPADDVEADLVEDLAVAAWKRRRYWSLEARLFNQSRIEFLNHAEPQEFATGPAHLDARVLRELSDETKALHLVGRFQSAHDRAYRRALEALHSLQTARKNEPNLANIPLSAAARPRPVSRALSAKHVAAAQARHAAAFG